MNFNQIIDQSILAYRKISLSTRVWSVSRWKKKHNIHLFVHSKSKGVNSTKCNSKVLFASSPLMDGQKRAFSDSFKWWRLGQHLVSGHRFILHGCRFWVAENSLKNKLDTALSLKLISREYSGLGEWMEEVQTTSNCLPWFTRETRNVYTGISVLPLAWHFTEFSAEEDDDSRTEQTLNHFRACFPKIPCQHEWNTMKTLKGSGVIFCTLSLLSAGNGVVFPVWFPS